MWLGQKVFKYRFTKFETQNFLLKHRHLLSYFDVSLLLAVLMWSLLRDLGDIVLGCCSYWSQAGCSQKVPYCCVVRNQLTLSQTADLQASLNSGPSESSLESFPLLL